MTDPQTLTIAYIVGVPIAAALTCWADEAADRFAGWWVGSIWPLVAVGLLLYAAYCAPQWLGRKLRSILPW